MTLKTFVLTKNDNAAGNRPLPLLSVWSWEIRRVFAKRLNWGFGLASFIFFLGMLWFKHAWEMGTETSFPFILYGTSAIGMLYEFTVVLMLVFAFILPFVVTEGVARDYKNRSHEMLMATPLPTSAYVWGRFLAVLTIGLAQAVLMLLAVLLMGSFLHLRNAVYPQPILGNLISAWGLIVIPPTLLIAGIGFSLGTLWPRKTRTIMLGIVITWVLFYTVGQVLWINPTGINIIYNLIPQFIQTVEANFASIPVSQRDIWVGQLQAVSPNLGVWVLPQYSLASFGILLVLVAAIAFKRFRNELE